MSSSPSKMLNYVLPDNANKVKRKYIFRNLNGSRHNLYEVDTLYSCLTRGNVSGTSL